MKQYTKKLQSKKIIVIVVAVLAVLAGSYFAYATTNQTPNEDGTPTTVNKDKPTDEQVQAGNSIKESTGNKTGNSDSPKPPVPQDNGKSKAVTTITAANKNEETLQIRTLIEVVSGSGQCTLTLSNGAKTITKSSDLQALPSTTTCRGFDVPLSELSPGEWQIKVDYTSDAYEGTATSKVTL